MQKKLVNRRLLRRASLRESERGFCLVVIFSLVSSEKDGQFAWLCVARKKCKFALLSLLHICRPSYREPRHTNGNTTNMSPTARQLSPKTVALLKFLAGKHGEVTITSLMKLAYLADYVLVQHGHGKISDFEYYRYFYGPFDGAIYSYLEDLTQKGEFNSHTEYSAFGEYQVYSINEAAEIAATGLEQEEIELVSALLDQVKGYGPRMLTEAAYKTPPMLKIGAEIGNTEGLGVALDLSTPLSK